MFQVQGNGPDQALDLTQGFFARLLEKGIVAAADPGKGRFRAFLRTDCQHFLIDQFRRTTAWGGGIPTVSIDAHGAEDRYRFEPADTLTPDRLFDRAWALTLLETRPRPAGPRVRRQGPFRVVRPPQDRPHPREGRGFGRDPGCSSSARPRRP